MEKELNIAVILKDKPRGLKLWSDTFGVVYSGYIDDNCDFPISISVNDHEVILTRDGRITYEDGTLPCIVPSKEMRDWEKFAWKKGDVLTTKNKSLTVVFEHFNATYESFVAKYSFCSYQEKNEDDAWNKEGENSYKTLCFSKVSDDEAKEFIKIVESHYGGKLNLETLTIEQPKPEFKDGDIVHYPAGDITDEAIFIAKVESKGVLHSYVYMSKDNIIPHIGSSFSVSGCLDSLRLATDSEKQQLFDALAKEGKVWNPDTKTIVDLSKKCEFKPMDWCLMRDIEYDENDKMLFAFDWILCQYSNHHGYGKEFVAVGGKEFDECIPYNDSTKHLLGTTDEWKGGNNG